MTKPMQKHQSPAMQAIEQPLSEIISSSMPKGKMEADITKVPKQTINKKIGCEAVTYNCKTTEPSKKFQNVQTSSAYLV